MHTDMNVYNADISRHQDFREQREVIQVEPNTHMNVYNADLSHHNRDFGELLPQILEPNTYSDRNDMYADLLLRYHRDSGEQRLEMQEANTLSNMNVYAHLCRQRKLDEQRRKMAEPSDLLHKALAAIHTIVDCVALVAEEEDTANMNMNMNAASTTITNDNNPSNDNHNPMYHNLQPPSSPLLSSSAMDFQHHLRQLQQQQQMKSSPLLSSSAMDFQQHLRQLQQQQQMQHELHQLQKRQQELVQMIGTNTTTMTQKYNSPDAPMSMPLSQHQQENKKEEQQQLQSSPATASVTITPPVTKNKKVNYGNTNCTIDLTGAKEPTRTVGNNNIVPSELDILIGRGKGVDNHTGNIYYRTVVESFRKQYEAISNKGVKTEFIRDVVDIIYENGHQFVKKVQDPHPSNGSAATTTSTCTYTWVSVDRDVARTKVSHSFRNAKRLRTASASASASASTSTSTNNKYSSRTRTTQHPL